MQISHELTPQLFKYFDKYNEYDFILPRFWEKSKEYKNFYQKSNKFKILDNGLFEGDNYTFTKLIDIINEVKPNIFVIPDAWNDNKITLRNAKYWFNTIKPQLFYDVDLMVVLQGNNFLEFKELYKQCEDLGIRHFSFNFSSNAYINLFSHPNKLINQMFGRIYFITEFYNQKIIQENHYIHLLGGSVPQEFLYYPKEWKFIKSLDTSNPIINGALGVKYNDWGLLDKPKEKLEEFFEKDLSSKIEIINYNINKFKSFINKN